MGKGFNNWDDVWWSWVKRGAPYEEAAFRANEWKRHRKGRRAMKDKLTHFGWAVLGQLARGPVWDGILICKSGRDELVAHGLAQRIRKDERGLMINELTSEGYRLTSQLADSNQAATAA